MRLGIREMRRQPGRFVTAVVILTLIATLLMLLGGLLDGLIRQATGAIEANGPTSSCSRRRPNGRCCAAGSPELRAQIAAVEASRASAASA